MDHKSETCYKVDRPIGCFKGDKSFDPNYNEITSVFDQDKKNTEKMILIAQFPETSNKYPAVKVYRDRYDSSKAGGTANHILKLVK